MLVETILKITPCSIFLPCGSSNFGKGIDHIGDAAILRHDTSSCFLFRGLCKLGAYSPKARQDIPVTRRIGPLHYDAGRWEGFALADCLEAIYIELRVQAKKKSPQPRGFSAT
jgi:hypothetical protein